MKAQVLQGSKQEIANAVLAIPGEVREAIIVIEEPSDVVQNPPGEDIFAEMEPYTVKVYSPVDYSREAIYTRMPGG
jgi:hypothetical protein